ncbi:Monooxygenase FAD-binding protein OS=Tsukamurella paurometabola (strain ATCC 8368 / DSM / CCUG 35730 / CIP 100753 / JCM 10117 / KCTC 9821 / NBRC 16120 /NCIMB 702349 / NCTC 13040) OX=521096 GN=Tpau_0310 PE=4 SV=1 [Tsukamurella paurometabola]|uniref:Monooxygenase FAD-binding protein n=1 Tax=Tsukamurella paurometabola (strain ATCC 8368 / DSM 20162 / CCUG 35730 / CIP 100753 / JCM 10117 / KCTC 9821 / NBRC 16120 / NCIMB 702349 / NCTC 13040) TaxID=521096 RepID=D5URA3_TSUPD|nr:FAD-dependent monooxygenase [Tsukamurella paurometabola]ADG76956.1 monooxygenase FAD-binding protein [Tsukamurella paurometabola DSM 20162]SUP42319.1 6-hydroxynicotinate 3-monooxygenase precursor [Tsukamurella paurometabola]
MIGTSTVEVAVVGGGIGGLSAAVSLMSVGIDATVYERAPELGEVGAGVSLQPNALRVYEQIGILDDIKDIGSPMNRTLYLTAGGALVEQEGYTGIGVYRPDLIEVLKSKLPPENIKLGKQAIGYTESGNKALVEFADNTTELADVVIAADGIRSTLRRSLNSDNDGFVFSGLMAYRGVLPTSAVPDFPAEAAIDWMGGGRFIRAYRLRNGQLLNWIAVVPTDNIFSENWTLPGNPDELRKEFPSKNWDPLAINILKQVQTTARYALFDRDPILEWHRDRVVLLGDAAHPMLPHDRAGRKLCNRRRDCDR